MSDRVVDLAVELLAHPNWGSGDSHPTERVDLQLHPGVFPPNLPFDLPVPYGSRVVGSMMRGTRSTTIFDVPSEPGAVTDWYRARFSDQGWTSWSFEDWVRRRANEAEHAGTRQERPPWQESSVTVCRPPSGPLLHIDARPNGDGTSAVKLLITLKPDPDQCENPAAWLRPWNEPRLDGPQRPLEEMEPPPESDLRRGGSGSSSGGHAHVHADLVTALAPDAVAAHYRQQWTDRGWELQAEEVNGPLAWSVWKRTNERGEKERGTWRAVRLPETPDRYVVEMTIDRSEGDG